MITGEILLEIGIKPNPRFKEALTDANNSVNSGKSWEETKNYLLEKYKEVEKLQLLPKRPEILAVACDPNSKEEINNVENSKKKMEELSQIPIVEALSLMPDNCPSGNEWGSIPVGGAITTKHHIIPAAHSSDLFCSMSATFFQTKELTKELIKKLGENTHFGPYPTPEGKENQHPILLENKEIWNNPFLKNLDQIALKYLGTQGDGNHFAYIGELEINNKLILEIEKSGNYTISKNLHKFNKETLKVLVTHHGSRNLGARVYKKGVETAIRETEKIAQGIPKNGAWLDTTTTLGKEYLEALNFIGKWTKANHEVIHQKFLKAVGSEKITNIGNEHNAIWEHNSMIYHGKGATPAWEKNGKPQLGIIPLNMGREILLVSGLNNKKFLSFAPHGAGRNKSRTATLIPFLNSKGVLDKEKVEQSLTEQTQGLCIAWASGKPDISESPLGYKSASKIKEELEKYSLATIIGEIQPKGCIMAGHIEPLWKKEKKKRREEVNDPTLTL